MTSVHHSPAPSAGQGTGGGTAAGPVGATTSGHYALRPLAFDSVQLRPEGHLGSWQELNRTSTIPHCIDNLESSGALDNFRRLVGESDAAFRGFWFQDSDLYKTLEAVGWEAGRQADPRWEEYVASMGELLAKVQEPDGYLNTWVQGVEPGKRWDKLQWSHELYTAGHLLQAAVAVARTTGNGAVVEVARRVADCIVENFGPGGAEKIDGHPEVETALVELYRLTGDKRYLETAVRQLELRGHGILPDDRFGRQYFQDHLPIRKAAHEATGHAVRQVYLSTGVADAYLENGDASLLEAAESLWENIFTQKAYLTGALGSRHRDEAFGDAFELPPDRAYAETCASIASLHFSWRLLLATGNSKYADEMERALYNGIAASTSVEGNSFFYSNPLQLRTGHDGSTEDAPSERLSWYACACCPPNLARLVASLHHYVATQDESGLQLQLLHDGEIRASGEPFGGEITVATTTEYPWDEKASIEVTAPAGEWTLSVRIPSWCKDPEVTIGGKPIEAVTDASGYLRLSRDWEGNTIVLLTLPMPVQIVSAHPRVDAVRGTVALVRGPVVYCLEQHDQADGVVLEDLAVDAAAPVEIAAAEGIPGVRTVLKAAGVARPQSEQALYRTSGTEAAEQRPVELTAIPYFRWANRGPAAMRVWIPLA